MVIKSATDKILLIIKYLKLISVHWIKAILSQLLKITLNL